MDFRTEPEATPAALDRALAAGFTHALVSCASAGLAGLPPGNSGLLTYADGAWHVTAAWPLPAGLKGARYSAMLPHGALCDEKEGRKQSFFE